MNRKTIALDFDAVLHTYVGWRDGHMDVPIAGSRDAVLELQRRGFEVVVFTTRSPEDVERFLSENDFPALFVTRVKLPFVVMVDDRAIRFEGRWTPELIDQIASFRPYWEIAGR